MCFFNGQGRIQSPNAPRPTQLASGYACYGAVALAAVNNTCGALRERNGRHYRIGQPNGAMPAVQVNLACHHVIGWDVIWNFWNTLIERRDFKLARSYLAVCGVPQPATAKLEQDTAKGKFAAGTSWDAKLCWNPINLVRGPENRSDDPNANVGLEEKIDFQRAPADAYGKRIAGLVEAGRAMCAYINMQNTAAKASKAIAYLTSIRSEGIMEWDESLWVVDKRHPDYSSTPSPTGGFVVVHPTWKIHTS